MKKNVVILILVLAIVFVLAAALQNYHSFNFKIISQYFKGSITSPAKFTGTLDLSQNASYKSQSFTAPQTKFKLADFTLKNNTNEVINLKKVEADLTVNSNLYISNVFVSNLYLVYGEKKLETFNPILHSNYWTVNYLLPAGQTVDLSIFCDVSSIIPLNSVIGSAMLASGVSATTNTNVSTNSNKVLSGQNITFSTPSLTASIDSSTPAAALVIAGKRVLAGKFKFTTSSDSYTLSQLRFVIPGSHFGFDYISSVADVDLFDPDSKTLFTPKPVPPYFDGANYVANFDINVPIGINSSKSLWVYYDLKSNIDSYSTNNNIAPILAYVKASNSKGAIFDGIATKYANTIASYKGITLPPGGVSANNLNIFKSLPALTGVASSATAPDNSTVDLYTFSISADAAGDISLKQLTFITTLKTPNKKNPRLSHFTLLKGNSDYTSSVAIFDVINNNYIYLTGSNAIGTGINNNVVVTFFTEEKIPAGKTQTYTLRANVDNFIKADKLGPASISTYIPSDTKMLNGAYYLKNLYPNIYFGLAHLYTDLGGTPYNLLWSDKTSPFPNPHNDYNGSYTGDWYNGYGVLSLPLPAQTITAK